MVVCILWHIKSNSAQHSSGFLNESKALTRSKMHVWQTSFFNPLIPGVRKRSHILKKNNNAFMFILKV